MQWVHVLYVVYSEWSVLCTVCMVCIMCSVQCAIRTVCSLQSSCLTPVSSFFEQTRVEWLEDWRSGDWRTGWLEAWRNGWLEAWRIGGLEDFMTGDLEDWMTGGLGKQTCTNTRNTYIHTYINRHRLKGCICPALGGRGRSKEERFSCGQYPLLPPSWTVNCWSCYGSSISIPKSSKPFMLLLSQAPCWTPSTGP